MHEHQSLAFYCGTLPNTADSRDGSELASDLHRTGFNSASKTHSGANNVNSVVSETTCASRTNSQAHKHQSHWNNTPK